MAGTEILQFSDPALLAQPHDFLARLREESPVRAVIDPRGSRIFLVTSYKLIEEATRRTEDFSSDMAHLLLSTDSTNEEAARIMSHEPTASALLLITDDPAHKRYRSLVNAVFTQGRVANLAPILERIVDELIDGMLAKGKGDFVNDFAVLLPIYAIADILGFKRGDYDRVRAWSDSAILIASRMGTPEQEVAAARSVIEFRGFIREMIRLRREQPSDDLISNLVNIRVDGVESLSDDEASALTFEIAIAGNETTRNTLMSGFVQLLRHPEQLQAIIADPSLTRGAVDEMLRYETPATSIWRVATRDTELNGVAIPKGAEVLLRFDAGNRDPEKFSDPDQFDIRRSNAHVHMSFGAPGIHRCLGQMLARKELAIALPRLLARLHNIRIIEEVSDTNYWPGLLHRGIGSLWIDFDAQEAGAAA